MPITHATSTNMKCSSCRGFRPLLALLLSGLVLSDAVKVHVFTNVTSADYRYPEINPESQFYVASLQQKPSLGIAVSGGQGGWRAAALAYGWLRASHLLNITSQAQYISTTSAGAWAVVPYAYTTTPLNRFFSPYFEPSNLSRARLSALTPGSWSTYAADKTLLNGVLGNLVSAPGEPTSWAVNLANIFLTPFGLGASESSVSAAGTKGNVLNSTRAQLPEGFPVHVACQDDRPFPITVASIMTPERAVTPKFFPWEFTPLYVGMAPLARYNKPIALGGGLVEPLGFNSQPPRTRVISKSGEEEVEVTPLAAKGTSSLVHVVGISSSATAARMKVTNPLAAGLFNGQSVNYWNLWDYKAAKLAFADGGVVDPLGIMPLLRRGVKNVIACVATRTEPVVSLNQFAVEEYGLSGLFGAFPLDARNELGRPLLLHGTDDPASWIDMQQVFPRDGFEDLYRAFRDSSEAGDAHVFARSYEVLPNPFMGVSGGYQVNVLWVLNGRSTQWEQALPEDTLQWLEKERNGSGPYRYFPNVQHTLQAPGALINLLSQQASWVFRQKKTEVLEFVAAAQGSSSGPGEEVVHGSSYRR